MKSVYWTAGLCVVVLASVVASAQAPDLENMDFVLRSVPNGPVALVDGNPVDREDFVALYQTELAAYALRMKENVTDKVRLQAALRSLSALIQREVLYQEAQRLNLTVSEDEARKQWATEIASLKEAFQKPGQSLSETDALEKAGTTPERAKAELKRSLMIEKMRERIAREKVTVSDSEIRQFFEENKSRFKQPQGIHLEQIFVSTRGSSESPEQKKAQARAKIDKALKRIEAGEKFQAVAKAVSEAPDKDRGGDMGMLPAPELPPFFLEAVAQMKPGDISGVLESSMGFHLIKLIETQASSDVGYEKASKHIRDMLTDQKTDRAVAAFCDPFLTKPNYVTLYLDLEKTLGTDPKYAELLNMLAPPTGNNP